MKILVLSNLYPPDVIGGYELGCRQVVDALLERGHDVRVLTTAPRQPVAHAPHVKRRLKLSEIWSKAVSDRSHPVQSHLMDSAATFINASNCHVLIDEIREFEPDVVYVWMLTGTGGLGLMACLEFLKVPWLWHLMDPVPTLLCRRFGEVVPALVKAFERSMSEGMYLSCSQQLVGEIASDGLDLNHRTKVMPNWITGSLPPPRTEYLQDGVLRIAAASAQIIRDNQKGIDIVVESAAQLRERGFENFQIDIYGRLVDFSMPELALKLGLEEHVRFLGSRTQSELIGMYDQYDLFAFPTRTREPFGFAALEAGARGCVPVMTNVCGIAEWFVHGVHVLKIKRNAQAMADAYASVLNGSVDLTRMGQRLSSVIRRDFSLAALLPTIEESLGQAQVRSRAGAGTPEQAYRMALLAERLSHAMIQEPWVRSA
ncbi:MAG TPA: glycosyltransferase family 4 protein [Isosphaeraceae bacterium]|nr:glycosyltransferase family 4 protein [Isosphaeraceae bacterium]